MGRYNDSRDADDRTQRRLERVDEVAPTHERLTLLLSETLRLRLSPRCYGILKKMAGMSPDRRLALNLRMVADLMCEVEIKDVLRDGLTPGERAALIEIDTAQTSTVVRQTAHALFDIETRAVYCEIFRSRFRQRRTCKTEMLETRPLD